MSDNNINALDPITERRFSPRLIDLKYHFPKGHPKIQIISAYTKTGSLVRCKSTPDGKLYSAIIKTSKGELNQKEEHTITKKDFDKLWHNRQYFTKRHRYLIPYNNLIIELDVYQWHLKGYIQIIIKFDSEEDAVLFEPEPWMNIEVTGVFEHYDYSLARNGKPKRN